MFSFLKDSVGVHDSPELQIHAEKVFEMVRLSNINELFYFYSSFNMDVPLKLCLIKTAND
jgi:hypothetical protein